MRTEIGKKGKVFRYDPLRDQFTLVYKLPEEKIKDVLANKVSPALQMHGGDCSFVKYDEPTGTLYVAMQGACGTCPFALETLRMTVEQAIIAEVPEVKAVERA